uniref:RNA helicase n=1 Tax=Plectus sambesii TaxID=2011161 RepID=A0A914X7N1_9BILA
MAESDGEGDYSALTAAFNRKQKKSGGWQALGLDHTLFKGIDRKGYRVPTPIQRKAIPPIIDGKDVVAMSRTGSGKTAAFVVPMLQKLKRRSTMGARALLVSPTRELALQTFKVIKEIGRFTGLRAAALVGGDSMDEQFSVIHSNPDILVATPGRLLHLVVEMNLKLTSVEYVVFDEADRLFEMGFAEQLSEVLKRLPDHRQTLLFSATLPKMLVDFAKAGLTDPVLVRLDVETKISEQLETAFLTCRAHDKMATFLYLVRKIMQNSDEQTIVFCATMKHVEHLVAVLQQAGIESSYLFSQLDSGARNINITRFRKRQTRLLVVTDVAARGVDIPLLDNAINFHFPPKSKLFVHRVGRVARAGKSGKSYSLVAPDEIPYLIDLFLFLGRPLTFAPKDGPAKGDELVGCVPQTVLDSEAEFLKTAHEHSFELTDLRQKAENAMSKYLRSRPQPSTESVRRAKHELRTVVAASGRHAVFKDVDDNDQARNQLLEGLRNFRPSATIFEVNAGSKQEPAAVMKAKRRAHQKYIGRPQEKSSSQSVVNSDSFHQTAATLENVETVFSEIIGRADAPKKKRVKKGAQAEAQKAEFFVPYTPADYRSEQAMAVDKGFDQRAKEAEMDMTGDTGDDMNKQRQQMTWNRKLKRFVGESGNEPSKKKIRTEEGTILPATYKSGRYEQWQKKQKMGNQREVSDDEQDDDRQQPAYPRKRSRYASNTSDNAPKRPVRSELKNKDQILKERRRKERVQGYQTYRKTENSKRKPGQGRR